MKRRNKKKRQWRQREICSREKKNCCSRAKARPGGRSVVVRRPKGWARREDRLRGGCSARNTNVLRGFGRDKEEWRDGSGNRAIIADRLYARICVPFFCRSQSVGVLCVCVCVFAVRRVAVVGRFGWLQQFGPVGGVPLDRTVLLRKMHGHISGLGMQCLRLGDVCMKE